MTAFRRNDIEPPTPYGGIAKEYYDATLHPTCASLRELSEKYIRQRLARSAKKSDLIVEVGAGKSIVAPTLIDVTGLNNVFITDSAPEMLSHSSEWEHFGAKLIQADALRLPFSDGSVALLVSSLGDPYNTGLFWQEVARVLRPGALCYFTTPAHEWASTFRRQDMIQAAEFLRSDGETLFMPSYTFLYQQQKELLLKSGLKISEAVPFFNSDLKDKSAPKLLCVENGSPVLWGYSLVS